MKAAAYTTESVSKQGEADWRMFLKKGEEKISFFHDIPLFADKTKNLLNMVVEIPRGTNAKLEISREEDMNPIKQDEKKGKLRFVHDKYPFNYGAFPQTWENPLVTHPETKAKGDKDPLDVCEVGSADAKTGEIKVVKILGTWAMIDDGETDWKILVIDVNDPKADKINSAEDLEKEMPGTAKKVFEFLRDYKIPDGNPPNKFGFDSKLMDAKYAMTIIEETHDEWHKIVTGKLESKTDKYFINCKNKLIEGSPHKVTK